MLMLLSAYEVHALYGGEILDFYTLFLANRLFQRILAVIIGGGGKAYPAPPPNSEYWRAAPPRPLVPTPLIWCSIKLEGEPQMI